MISFSAFICAHKGFCGIIANGSWSLLAQINPGALPPGGQWTIHSLLGIAVVFLYRELTAEKKSKKELQDKLISVLTEVADNHRDDENSMRDQLRQAWGKNHKDNK